MELNISIVDLNYKNVVHDLKGFCMYLRLAKSDLPLCFCNFVGLYATLHWTCDRCNWCGEFMDKIAELFQKVSEDIYRGCKDRPIVLLLFLSMTWNWLVIDCMGLLSYCVIVCLLIWWKYELLSIKSKILH